ncbi:hypothetical protein AT248_03360 [Bartonella henselae]|nr:hypothetical protein BhenCHDE101_08015 [Bartonella henselae]OLL43079.1 hypothetical protein AT242_03485 [Bartonella henselae]OLL57116.1 hypothetical protein AT248_03360 [Bartonella henselae]PNM39075.1 hypothetical protein AL470_007360 [Bartonella henselae str. Houston-1]
MPVLHHWHVGELFTRVGEIETIRGFFMGNIAIAGSNVLFAIIYLWQFFHQCVFHLYYSYHFSFIDWVVFL